MKYITLLIILFALSTNATGGINARLDASIELIAVLQINDNSSSKKLGKDICLSGGRASHECYNATIGAGLCLAGGRASYECYNATIGAGLCLAGGRASHECYNASTGAGICLAAGKASHECYNANTGAGICLAAGKASHECYRMSVSQALKLPKIDTDWKWDEFRSTNAYGNIWGCRGTRTGQFADDYKCSGERKTDDTWPNN